MNIVMPAHPSASKFKVLNILLILSVMVGAPSKLQAGYGVFTVETLQTATTDELKQTEATQIFIRNPQGEPVTTLNCAGNARITQAVGDDQGHTLLIGYFTGTLFQGSRMLRSNSQNLFSMVINRQGEPLSLHRIGGPDAGWGEGIALEEDGFAVSVFLSHPENGEEPLRILFNEWGEPINPIDDSRFHQDVFSGVNYLEDDTGEDETEDPEG